MRSSSQQCPRRDLLIIISITHYVQRLVLCLGRTFIEKYEVGQSNYDASRVVFCNTFQQGHLENIGFIPEIREGQGDEIFNVLDRS